MTNSVPAQGYDAHEGGPLFNALFKDYFGALSDETLRPEAYIAISWQRPGERMHNEFYGDTYLAACRAADLREQKVNAYFAVAPRKKPSRRGKAIRHLLTLHVDVDSYRAAVERKIRHGMPSALIASGRGLHAYWFLETPLKSPQYDRVVGDLNRQLVRRFGGDSNSSDVARILRIPGTFNVKNPAKPLPVEIIELEPKLRYPIEDLTERFGSNLIERPLRVVKREDKDFAPRGRLLGSDERAYLDRLLREGLFEPSSRNHAILLLCRHCLGQGMPRDEAKSFIVGFFEARHNHLSRDWIADREGCIRHVGAAVDDCWNKAPTWKQMYRGRGREGANRRLAASDLSYVDSLSLADRDKLFLTDALEFILNHQRDGVIVLESRQIMKFRHCHSRNYKQRYQLLERLAIIRLKARYKKAERLGAEFYVLYNFRDDVKRQRDSQEDAARTLVEIEENRLPLAA